MNHYLREAMRARGWTIPKLAEACDVAVGLAQRWVSDNPRYRVTPSPASCEKIATALGVDLDETLAIAGHRPPRQEHVDDDPIEQYIREGTRQMHELLDGIPRVYWPTIVRKAFDRALDGARDMAQLLADQQTRERPTTTRGVAPAKGSSARSSYGADTGPDQLKTRQRVGSLALAGA
jgi:transcriptional regulator with XRE-family HTH domain